MIASLSSLVVIRIEFDDSYGIFLVDFPAEKIYGLDGKEIEGETKSEIISKIKGKEQEIPEMPYEQIYEVMNTEKKIQEENNKHIFRRGTE